MATTTHYILGGGSGTSTHIDIGAGNFAGSAVNGQEFKVTGSDGDNSFFLHPGYEYGVDFTENGAGADKIYFAGNRDDFTVTLDEGLVTIYGNSATESSGVGARVSSVSNMTLVFNDGWIAANEITEEGGEELQTDETSLAPSLPETLDGTAKVAVYSTDGTDNIAGERGAVFTTYGNAGVDTVWVTAGAQVDATQMGVGEDRIWLEGSWADYTKSLDGNTITLTRTVADPFGGDPAQEVVKVVGGFGASNDKLYFFDGAINTRSAYKALIDDLNVDVAGLDAAFETGIKSFSSGEEVGGLSLANDTNSPDDGITSDGTVTVEGVGSYYRWQYSTDGGNTWTEGDGNSFVLDGQSSGGEGVTYAAADVLVRQINPYGVVGEAESLAGDVVVDNAAGEVGIAQRAALAARTGFDGQTTEAARLEASGITTSSADYTVQFWVYIDQAVADDTSNDFQLIDGTDSVAAIVRNGELLLWDGSDYVAGASTTADIAEGWNFVSITRSSATMSATVVNDDNALGTVTDNVTVSTSFAGGTLSHRIGADESNGSLLDAYWREFRFYDTDRSATAVADSATAISEDDAGLVSWFKLNDKNGAIVNYDAEDVGSMAVADGAQIGQEPTSAYTGPGAGDARVSPTPTISGTAEAGATVTISYDDGSGAIEAGTAEANESGAWSYTFETELAEGDYTITAVQQDLAGNTSAAADYNGTLTVSAAVPVTPDLEAASDSGSSSTDNITNEGLPTISGSLPSGTTEGVAVSIYMDGVAVATATSSTPVDGLTVDYVEGTWSYTAQSPITDGTHTFVQEVDGVQSDALEVVIDTADVGVNISTEIEMYQTAAYPETTTEDLTITGTVDADATTVSITWDDGDAGTPDLARNADINTLTGVWSISFTAEELEALLDGAVTFTVEATDVAGNTGTEVSDSFILELENQAPEVSGVTIDNPSVFIGSAAETEILNLNDLSGDGEATTDDVAFTDPDAPGSNNATLRYSGELQGGGDLPSWLEVSSDGIIKVASGESAPAEAESITITVTAMDGDFNEVSRDVTIDLVGPFDLTSPMDEAEALDVRSDIVLSGSEALAFGADGDYTITFTDTQAGEAGFDGETGDGSITLTVSIAGGAVSEVSGGGSVVIDGANLVISLDQDLDLATAYTVSVDAGLVQTEVDGLPSAALADLAFTTVDPSTEGAVADIWDGSDLVAGATWYDGTSGNYVSNSEGLTVNLDSVEGIVAVGRDIDTEDGIVLQHASRTVLTGFGGDDLLYVDNAVGSQANTYSEDAISLLSSDGDVPTLLTFSAQNGGQAGVFVTFADDASTSEMDESAEVAVAFSDSSDLLPNEHSFEELTGNAAPVIGA